MISLRRGRHRGTNRGTGPASSEDIGGGPDGAGVLRAGRRSADESGVTAVIVALMLFALVGISAFAIDLGAAYNNSQDLQAAADAAALAAAGYFRDTNQNCATPATADAGATAAATTLMADNHAWATTTDSGLTVACIQPGYEDFVAVGWENEATTQTAFAGALRDPVDELSSTRRAVAVLDAPAAGGFRPLALCSDELPPAGVDQVFVDFENNPAGCATAVGNWRELDCPERSGADYALTPGYLRDAIRYGCATPVYPVLGQPSSAPSRSAHLLACPGVTQRVCLGGNTDDPLTPSDDPLSTSVMKQWGEYVVDSEILITLPVLCGAPTPCNPAALQGADNLAVYPVYQLASARVCAVSDGTSETDYTNSAGACAGSSLLYGDGADRWMVLSVVEVFADDYPDVEDVTLRRIRLAE